MKKSATLGLVGLGLIFGTALAQDEKGAPAAPAAPAAPKTAAAGPALKTLREKASYGIGLSMGQRFKSQSIEIDASSIARGIADGISGAKPALTDAEIKECMESFQKELIAQQATRVDKLKKEGTAYLAANKAKKDVKTLASGLQYRVIKEGTGASPKLTDTVKANYKGTFVDGTEFDSSEKNGGPVSFPVNGVIKGWTEALQLMKVGSKWQLAIPSNLAYGPSGRDGIPPDSVLLFDIELVGIE